jgi:hypothetical protein
MDNETLSNKEFSQGFQKDVADLLELCMDNKTDNIIINLEYPKGILEIDMTFKVIPKRSQEDAK